MFHNLFPQCPFWIQLEISNPFCHWNWSYSRSWTPTLLTFFYNLHQLLFTNITSANLSLFNCLYIYLQLLTLVHVQTVVLSAVICLTDSVTLQSQISTISSAVLHVELLRLGELIYLSVSINYKLRCCAWRSVILIDYSGPANDTMLMKHSYISILLSESKWLILSRVLGLSFGCYLKLPSNFAPLTVAYVVIIQN